MGTLMWRAGLACLLLGGTCANQGVAQWAYADSSQAAAIHQFVVQLQSAVRKNDAAAIARVVAFPLRVNSAGHRHRYVRSDAAFVRDYARLFNANVRSAVLAQDPDSVFQDWKGLMLGRGHVWLSDDCALSRRLDQCLTITTLNLDAPPVAGRPAPSN